MGRLRSVGGSVNGATVSGSIAILCAATIGPGLILLHCIYAADRAREPVGNVLRYVRGGMAATLLASFIEGRIGVGPWLTRADDAPLAFFLMMVFGVGVAEEGAKLLVLYRRGRRDPHLDEPFDWVVYGVAVALGFATLENIAYVARGGLQVALARALTAVPMHALCGTIMGWRLSRGMLTPADARRQRVLALVEPALWHGTYDAFAGYSYAELWMATPVLLAIIVGQWVVGLRHVLWLRRHGTAVAGTPPILLPTLLLDARTRGATPDARSAPASEG